MVDVLLCDSMRSWFSNQKYLPFVQAFERETGLTVWKQEHADAVARNRGRNLYTSGWPDTILDANWNSRWYLARDFARLVPKARGEGCGRSRTSWYWQMSAYSPNHICSQECDGILRDRMVREREEAKEAARRRYEQAGELLNMAGALKRARAALRQRRSA